MARLIIAVVVGLVLPRADQCWRSGRSPRSPTGIPQASLYIYGIR
jgi:hypothetical protein